MEEYSRQVDDVEPVPESIEGSRGGGGDLVLQYPKPLADPPAVPPKRKEKRTVFCAVELFIEPAELIERGPFREVQATGNPEQPLRRKDSDVDPIVWTVERPSEGALKTCLS